MNLPLHKRYIFHPRIGINAGWRIQRKCWMLAVAGVIALSLYLADGWLSETLRRMDVEAAHISLKADVFRLANFGAPGWTWSGDTTDPQVRKPR